MGGHFRVLFLVCARLRRDEGGGEEGETEIILEGEGGEDGEGDTVMSGL